MGETGWRALRINPSVVQRQLLWFFSSGRLGRSKFFFSIFFSYHTLMAFIRHTKGHRINFVLKITQYQVLCMNAYRKWRKRISFLRCLTDKQTLKGKGPVSVHVFRPKVKLELWERCSESFSKLSYNVNTAVKVVTFIWHQSHLSRTCWGKKPLPGKTCLCQMDRSNPSE